MEQQFDRSISDEQVKERDAKIIKLFELANTNPAPDRKPADKIPYADSLRQRLQKTRA